MLKFHLLIKEGSRQYSRAWLMNLWLASTRSTSELLGLCWPKYNKQDHPQLAKGRASPSVLPSVTFFQSITKCLRVRLSKGLRWNGI